MPYTPYINIIEKDILQYINSITTETSLLDAMKYACLAGGKRIRPQLMFASAEINDIDFDDIRPLALALELIHSYSLIHDDLPAMDNSTLRRGKPTVHKVFGEGIAILAGDALLNCAMEILFAAAVNKPFLTKAAQMLAKKAGISGMIGGQALDISLTMQNAQGATVELMSALKTGALIEYALSAPCLVPHQLPSYADFASLGQKIGLLFQITDDLLDLSEEENEVTLASFYGIDWCKEQIETLEKECKDILQKYQEKGAKLAKIVHKLANRSI